MTTNHLLSENEEQSFSAAKFGLKNKDLQEIINVIHNCERIKLAKIFGSRAMGNYKPASDIDIAIFGNNITFNDVSHINYILNEETLMPYMFDVIHYEKLHNKDLQKHIDEIGQIIFSRNNDLSNE
jgi:predicted nucleotidyltransferase